LNNSVLSFRVVSAATDLTLTVRLDDLVIYQGVAPIDYQEVRHEFDDSTECEHVLSLELSGKLSEHTTLDVDGAIISDAVITISDIAFDDIALGHMFTQVTQYHHDHNGTTESVTEPFYGVMGCNGRAEMRFTTPIYLWLLENM
jgi:hypothetical protein